MSRTSITILAAICIAFQIASSVLILAAAPQEAKRPAVRLDDYGDPLPEHAVMRIGTVRLRPGGHIYTLAFAENGKKLVTVASGIGVQVWDVPTGKLLSHIGGDKVSSACAISPDGSLVTLFEGNGKGYRVFDTASGKATQHIAHANVRATLLAVSPDNCLLACIGTDPKEQRLPKEPTTKKNLWVWDLASANLVFSDYLHSKSGSDHSLVFAPDGKRLAFGGEKSPVLIWDMRSGKRLAELSTGKDTPGYGQLTFSADGLSITCQSRDFSQIVRWEIASGKQLLDQLKLEDEFRSGLLCPGGNTFLMGKEDCEISVHDVPTRRLLKTLEGNQNGVGRAAFSTDGKLLAAVCHDYVAQIWDLGTGKRLHEFAGHAAPWVRVRYSADGKEIVSSAGSWHKEACTFKFWDSETGKSLREIMWREKQYSVTAALSRDGSILAHYDDGKLKLKNLATGKTEGVLEVQSGGTRHIEMTDDGRYVAHHGSRQPKKPSPLSSTIVMLDTIHLWDAVANKKLLYLEGKDNEKLTCAFTSDGRFFTVHSRIRQGNTGKWIGTLRIWDLASGSKVCPLEVDMPAWWEIKHLSPSGRLLAIPPDSGKQKIEVRERVTGKLVCELPTPDLPRNGDAHPISVSPDGRVLAAGTTNGEVVLWDLFTSKQLVKLKGHRGLVESIDYSPDGRRLVSGGQGDTAILVWDVSPWTRRKGQEKSPTDQEITQWWQDLARQDQDDSAANAYAIIGRLLQSPKRTVEFLKKHLKPATAEESDSAVKLIAALASKTFADREKATAELNKIGPAAFPYLRAALEQKPAPEVRQRIEQLLSKIENRFPPEMLQVHRGLEILEMLSTPEAVQLLESLTRGSPDAWLTQEAEWTLKRLRKRPEK